MDIEKIKKVVSIIFLGALGSGLWSVAGEPTAGFIYETFTSAGGWIATSFGNSMNSGIGSGGWEDRGSLLFIIILIWAIALHITRKIISNYKNIYIVAGLTIAIFMGTVFASYKSIYAHKLTLYFNKNIEILAPHATSIEVLSARANYRSIDNLKTLNKAQHYINKLANKYAIKIQAFSL